MVIVYVDECARGSLFAPVRTGAVIWDINKPIEPPFVVKNWDSKKISPKKREILFDYIKNNAQEWAIGHADISEIDEMNILKATMLAFHRALDQIKMDFDEIYVDGNRFETYCGKDDFIPHKCIVKGDSIHYGIGMASILAKVTHDKYIDELCLKEPTLDEKYSLKSNKGYGTVKHVDGILKYGLTKYHRKSFKVKQIPEHYYLHE